MWNKISNYCERFRKFWNEDGSYTFILVPDDGREFKRKTYEKVINYAHGSRCPVQYGIL